MKIIRSGTRILAALVTILGCLLLFIPPLLADGDSASPPSPPLVALADTATGTVEVEGAREALARLKQGNERFVQHAEKHPDQAPQRIESLAAAQSPFAVILSCSDSRVPPELVFDQGLGDLFVVRVAGNTLNDTVLGSIEYAVEHLGSRLVVVMGHEKCGAVQAALSEHKEAGHIPSLTLPILPLLKEAQGEPGDPVHNAVVLNARHVAQQLRESDPLLKPRVASGSVMVVSAVYDLKNGQVTFDSEAPAPGKAAAPSKPAH